MKKVKIALKSVGTRKHLSTSVSLYLTSLPVYLSTSLDIAESPHKSDPSLDFFLFLGPAIPEGRT